MLGWLGATLGAPPLPEASKWPDPPDSAWLFLDTGVRLSVGGGGILYFGRQLSLHSTSFVPEPGSLLLLPVAMAGFARRIGTR